MRIFRKLVYALILVSLVLPIVAANASFDEFRDVAGHSAESVLRQAYNYGLIDGDNGFLYPDASITTGQALAILCRVLDVQTGANISKWGLAEGKWYYEYVAKAAHIGLITSIDESGINAPLSRQNAFYLFAEAFQLIEVEPDMSVLEKFSDSERIASENRPALASLISQGIVSGSGSRLSVDGDITRAVFLTVMYRIVRRYVPASDADANYEHGVLLQGSADLSENIFNRRVWFNSKASEIKLESVKAAEAIIRSDKLDSLEIGGSTHIKSLTMAAQSGDIDVHPIDDAVVETLIIGTGDGKVTATGVGSIEVTGNNRHVIITDSAESVIVSGRNNTVHVQADAQVGKVLLLMSAYGSRVVSDGTIGELEILSIGSSVSGKGDVETLKLSRPDTKIDVKYGKKIDNIDLGLTGASVKLTAPRRLPVGETLSASATIENAAPGTVCRFVWYLDDEVMLDRSITTGRTLPSLSHKFRYTRIMPESVNVRVTVSYTTAMGEYQELSAESVVRIDNHSKQHWMQLDSQDVLKKVTLGYKGDFTLEWALENDLDDYEKEVWVNAKGYKSKSEYLLWINLAYQRVNIFKRSGGSWELIRTCLVGTGAPGRGTPPGVWTTTYKQVNGWTTGSYTVKPVVRFRQGTGYAFHSRIYYPNTTRLKDPAIGYPISLGCIRMYDEDIWFIYDTIPDGTTVVVH